MSRRKPFEAPFENSKQSAALRSPSETAQPDEFLIAGIGASAGGLEAFKQLLSSLAVDTGIAFVLIQHLDPKHESMSAEILSRITPMPVVEVKDGMRVQPNHVYVIPANFGMGISQGVLKLIPRTEVRAQPRVIDYFLHSLAEDQKSRAVGIVLSGTGSDGTEGLISVKAEGGITFAQNPQSSKFDDMPKNAIASGSVDLILSPQEIAEELRRISHHQPSSALKPPSESEDHDQDLAPLPPGSLGQIFLLLRNICHVDFTHYKSNTIQRRIERRIILNKMKDIRAYVKLLSENPTEVKALYADILIHVTGFFRDPEAFEALGREVFPELLADRPSGQPLRVWVPGCSTGEEVYSIAILLLEFLGDRVSNTPVQIFASDISEQAIQKARLGEYPETIARAVSAERLNRFFLKMDNGYYKVSKSVRDICVFSRHDITVDPPFAKIDLLSCRNLLIYFTLVLQKQVIPVFHYALSPKGFLWLGRSETIGGFSSLFSLIDKTNKIYTRKNAPLALNLQFPASTYVPGKQEVVRKSPVFSKPGLDAQRLTELALQSEYPGVLINDEMEILQFRGRTVPFIEPSSGVASYHLLKMARPDFAPDLRRLIQTAKKQDAPARKDGLVLKDGRRNVTFNLKVIPIKPSSTSKERYYFILFENSLELKPSKKKAPRHTKTSPSQRMKTQTDPHMIELQEELMSSQEYQRSLIEKFEATQEDLTSANEELQSANEELQSTNEELETAKEELQSSNEELTTVNDELQSRSQEQVQLSNDLINLLGSVEIPILMLGNDHRIRRFTPLAGKALNLISSDVGRPISDLKLNFTSPGVDLDLDRLVSEVLETANAKEIEVQDRQGRWYRLQVRPYKTIDHRIDGAVLALVDIDVLKQSLKEVRAARTDAENANRGKDLFLATLSHELRTPLTSILSWAQMLRRGVLDEEKAKKGVATIEESANAQAQLINDLLDVSRIIAGKLTLELREINPGSVIRAAVEAVSAMAELKSIRIETTFDPTVGTVMADPVRLRQVFWNLLTNAIKFSVPGSKISVTLERSKEQVNQKAQAMIRVADVGKGINPAFLPHIFDRFSQEDGSSIRAHGGLGLGLAIVRNLVELHGGTIRAESGGKEKGAIFTVLLPTQSDRPIPGQPMGSDREADLATRLDGIRVLIVDDESNTKDAFTEMLRTLGAETEAAASAPEALELIHRFKPDVLVSDIAMPGEDGYSLIRKVRALAPEEGGNTPSIAVTAFAGTEDSNRAISAGFQAHLAKPQDILRLAETIAKLVGRTK